MQIIAEEKTYRFCAQSEEALARWLGALKSLIVKRRGKGGRVDEGGSGRMERVL